MREYLLDTNILGAYLRGRPRVIDHIQQCINDNEASTSIIVYGEIIEYFKSFSEYPRYRAALRTLLRKVHTYELHYALLERYADLRRAMRPPYGSGLIGDMDTLIAVTALHYRLTMVTTDSDFKRVPGLSLELLPVEILKS